MVKDILLFQTFRILRTVYGMIRQWHVLTINASIICNSLSYIAKLHHTISSLNN